MIDYATDDVEVVCCEGPPLCPFSDKAAFQNQLDGCPRCRRIIVHADGKETEYRTPVQ